jgi:hypothetical protein
VNGGHAALESMWQVDYWVASVDIRVVKIEYMA